MTALPMFDKILSWLSINQPPPTPVVIDPAGPRTLPGGWKILYDGYQLDGDIRSGIRATIPFIMDWTLAGTFIGQLIPASSGTPGSIIWNPPFAITYALGARIVPLYAQSFSCRPIGYRGTPATGGGLGFGDYFSDAMITVGFESTTMVQAGTSTDDPSGNNQLDPTNPITACEQSIQSTGKVETGPGGKWTYQSALLWSGKPVEGDVYTIRPEVRILCKFPRIPFLPWQLLQPYIGKINKTAILNCVKGSLLLEGAPTVITPNMDGSISQSLGLAFAFSPDPTGATIKGMDWNSQPFPDGSGYDIVVSSGDSTKSPYSYAEFADIFTAIDF